jgi:hypothetical protein
MSELWPKDEVAAADERETLLTFLLLFRATETVPASM